MGYKYKIGQEIEFTNEFYIKTESRKNIKVTKGDKAIVVKKINDTMGKIIYKTGEAKGISGKINIRVDDNIDAEKIAKKILQEI
ncbi:hypothetical protein [Clostridium rectalis]|uniref:hypothetical protein n=1 Tax=Clostridium rectalis TaxID=2040295 RepID=UPI000F63A39E|nr:hypothetical protein [Clostridium rectalis]